MSSFCTKSYSHFFSKKFQHICVSLDVNFNESLTNDIVSFEQLGPGVLIAGCLGISTSVPILHIQYFFKGNFCSTHKNTWHWSFLAYLRLIFNQIVIQSANAWYSYFLSRKSVNYNLFMLFETRNLHFNNFCKSAAILFCQMNKNVQECSQPEKWK